MQQESKNTNRNIRITIRLTATEHDKIMSYLKQTLYRKLSDYARKKLLDQPVKVFTRNKSLDLFMEEMVLLRKELNALGNNFNQVVKRMNASQHHGEVKILARIAIEQQRQLLEKTDKIQQDINQFSDQWFRNS